MSSEAIIEQFVVNAQKAAAQAVVVNSLDELGSGLAHALKDESAIYCPRLTELEKAIIIPPHITAENFLGASACVEEASYGIAETGSVVCTSEDAKQVQAGLLPSSHVVVLRRDKIIASLDDYFASCKDGPPANITFETGPSRTADIELTLQIGVHGPERLVILVF